jgi:arylformamidase
MVIRPMLPSSGELANAGGLMWKAPRPGLPPAADPQAPTLAVIHGGYWQMNDKENFAFFAKGLLPLGINLALTEYTLAPAARLDRIVAEVRRSVRWLAEHLAE